MNHCEGQAKGMARFAGIELKSEQIDGYVLARSSKDKELNSQCDQVLLESCLDDNQKIIFRKKFNNIFNQRV